MPAAIAALVAIAACGGAPHAARPTQTSASTSTIGSTRPAPVTPPTLAPYVSITAQAIVPHLAVFNRPGEHRSDGWVRVLLPIRPNGSTGWVRAVDVRLSPDVYKIRVQLLTHRITVFDQGAAAYTGPVADGAPATPTPTGHYYLRVLIKAPDPNTVYGPYAYGLSSHSDVLTAFDGGDGETGIHGNDDASVLGRSVTHGCIRIDNAEITRLAGTLPLGTPVDIEP